MHDFQGRKGQTLMPFKSVYEYREFAKAVRGKRRFIQTEMMANFLQCVSAGSKSRETKLPTGKVLWRAQIGGRERTRSDDHGHEWVEAAAPYGPDRMKPPVWHLSEGRVNPRGIAYLYLATDMETAIARSAPLVGCHSVRRGI
jgi:hypothetical protein